MGKSLEAEGQLEKLAQLIGPAIYNAYRATLTGSPAEITRAYYKRTSNPVVGDLVVESTTLYGMRHANSSPLDGVGFLEEIARERVDFGNPDFVWDEEAEGRPPPTEPVHYIRTLDGRRFRWTNAMFVCAVIDRNFSERP